MGDAFQRIVRIKHSRLVGCRASSAIVEMQLQSNFEMFGNQRMIEPSKAVDVPHHTSRSVKYLKEVSEKLLCPTSDLVDGTVIFQDFLNGAAIAEPKELGTPKKLPILADGPASTSGFADKRMEVAFPLGTAARPESDRPQTSSVHSNVEGASAFGTKQRKGSFGGVRVVGLHKDPAHAGASPICFQKTRERRIVTSKTG